MHIAKRNDLYTSKCIKTAQPIIISHLKYKHLTYLGLKLFFYYKFPSCSSYSMNQFMNVITLMSFPIGLIGFPIRLMLTPL